MECTEQNISFSLHEAYKEGSAPTYDELVKEVDLLEMTATVFMDDYIAMEVDYQTNYIKKDLERIADYYGISKRKKRKDELVEAIVIFEKDPDNLSVVFTRRKLWGYIDEIKRDKYLSKFLILD